MVSSEFITRLLDLPDRPAQLAYLRQADMAGETGLAELLAYGRQNAARDPAMSGALAAFIVETAPTSEAARLAPQAQYLQAQTLAMRGQFIPARALIEEARSGFLTLGDDLQAWRTTAGLMMVLGETGDYQVALKEANKAMAAMAAIPGEKDEFMGMLYQNRGMCYEHMGQYESALDDFNAAEERFARLDLLERQSSIVKNRGVLLLALGRATEALAAFNEAAALWDERDDPLRHGGNLDNIGYAYWQLGEYSQSLRYLQEAFETQEAAGLATYAHQKLVDAGDVYRTLNLLPEAADYYARAESVLAPADTPYYHARALYGWGITLAEQGLFIEAAQKLTLALDLFDQIGNTTLAAQTLLALATVVKGQGQSGEAGALAEKVIARAETIISPIPTFQAYLFLADLALGLGRHELCRAHLAEAELLLKELDAPPLRFGYHYLSGRLQQALGETAAAAATFQRAIDEIEHLRDMLLQPSLRTGYLDDKTGVYTALMALTLDQGDHRGAFAIAEKAKSRTLVELMAGAMDARLASSLPAETAEEWRRLRAELNAKYNQMLSDRSEERHSRPVIQAIIRDAARLEGELTRLQRRREIRSAWDASLGSSLPAGELDQHLPPEITLLAYHFLDDEIMAFVRQAGRITVRRDLASVSMINALAERLQVQWRRLNAGNYLSQRHLTQLERSAQGILQALNEALVAPLLDQIAGRQLVIIPHGILHRLPFHAFYDGGRYLIDDYIISYAPSVSAFALCQGRSRRTPSRFSLFGVGDDRLSNVSVELEAIAHQLPAAEVYQDQEAVIDQFQNQAPTADWLHVACHGIFRPDNPVYSSLRLHDGWLNARDVAALDLPDTLVTLSACESGVSQAGRGDEILGLTRAFLAAGASSLVVSLWLVEDAVAAQMMPAWYEALLSQPDRAAALRQAQLAVRQDYAHPFYWSPFCLTGKR